MVGVRVLVELVNGAVVIVALAPVCAATCKAYARDAKTAMNIFQIPVDSIALSPREGLEMEDGKEKELTSSYLPACLLAWTRPSSISQADHDGD